MYNLLKYWVSIRFLPESPRWLMSKGRIDEVNFIMKNCAEVNGKELTADLLPKLQVITVLYSFAQLKPSVACLQRKLTVDSMTRQEKASKPSIGVASLFRTPNMRLKTMLITFNWYCSLITFLLFQINNEFICQVCQ